MMWREKPAELTDAQTILALQDLDELASTSNHRCHALNEVLRRSTCPDWLVTVAATVVARTGRADIMSDPIITLTILIKNRVPLPLRAEMSQIPGYTSLAPWGLFGKLDRENHLLVEAIYPELSDLPLRMLVETLATLPVPDWTAEVPAKFLPDVEELLVKVEQNRRVPAGTYPALGGH